VASIRATFVLQLVVVQPFRLYPYHGHLRQHPTTNRLLKRLVLEAFEPLLGCFQQIAVGLNQASVRCQLRDEQQLLVDSAIKATLEKLQLDPSTSTNEISGGRVLRPLSKKGFKKHFTALRFFLCLIGDFESVLMLLPVRLDGFCPGLDGL
jgi:hypothetical protein